MDAKNCHHCGYDWIPRKADPKKCPQCQNSLWKSPRGKRKGVTPVVQVEAQVESPVEVAPEVAKPFTMDLSVAKARAESLFSQLI
jgi:hypothetical protein